MKWINLVLWYLSFIIIVFGADYLYTRNFVPTNSTEKSKSPKGFRIRHNYFSHTLPGNFHGTSVWGEENYEICTNAHGFKDNCKNLGNNNKSFDVAFIGDSFTEAIGMEYEQSFVGKFSAQYPNLKVANLGVAGYSPSIYLKKIEWYLDKGLEFDHVIAFVDISDIQDEALRYSEASDGSIIYKGVQYTPLARLKLFIKNNFHFFSLAYMELKSGITSKDKNRAKVFNRPIAEWTYNAESSAYGEMGVQGAIKKTKNYMRRLDVLLKENNIKLSVGVYPHPAQLKETGDGKSLQVKIWREFCENRCEMFINAFSEFDKKFISSSAEEVYDKYYIWGDVHYNALGNKVVFSALNEAYRKYIFSKQKEP